MAGGGGALKLHILLEKQDEGGYTAYVPELPGCISQGETRKEAVKNIKEAISLYLDELSHKAAKKPQKVDVLSLTVNA